MGENVTIKIIYHNEETDEHLEHHVSWQKVPDQSRVLDRAKDMIDALYQQVR